MVSRKYVSMNWLVRNDWQLQFTAIFDNCDQYFFVLKPLMMVWLSVVQTNISHILSLMHHWLPETLGLFPAEKFREGGIVQCPVCYPRIHFYSSLITNRVDWEGLHLINLWLKQSEIIFFREESARTGELIISFFLKRCVCEILFRCFKSILNLYLVQKKLLQLNVFYTMEIYKICFASVILSITINFYWTCWFSMKHQ